MSDITLENFEIYGGSSNTSHGDHYLSAIDRLTFKNIHFHSGSGSAPLASFRDICGLSISGFTSHLSGNPTSDLNVASSVSNLRLDGGAPVCDGTGPTPTKKPATPTPTSTPIPGDIDGDGDVDVDDYNILLEYFGKSGISIADIDGNGKVDIFDYNILVGNFGLGGGLVATNTPTPPAGATNTPTPGGSITLTAEIHAIPDYGNAPLTNVDLQGDVTGTATGSIYWQFDCTNDGSFEHTTTNNQESYTIKDLCNYLTPGSYTSKVVATRAGITASDTIRSTVE